MTKKELKGEIEKIFPEAEDVVVTISHSSNTIRMEIAAMYEAPGRSLKRLIELSRLLGTNEIEEDIDIRAQGCESCDYGSRYGVELIAPLCIEVED